MMKYRLAFEIQTYKDQAQLLEELQEFALDMSPSWVDTLFDKLGPVGIDYSRGEEAVINSCCVSIVEDDQDEA